MNEPILVLFCRKPAPGVGKQRLAAALGDASALRISQALLDCALEDARTWRGAVVIAPADDRDRDWARGLLQRVDDVVPQVDAQVDAGSPRIGFGERIEHVDRVLRARGAQRVLFIGSDAPGLDAHYLDAAGRALQQDDVVVGPASDGGVTAMGARVAWPSLAALPWSQSTLGAALTQACRVAGLSVAALPESYDLDTVADIAPALARLQGDARPARRRLVAVLLDLQRESAA